MSYASQVLGGSTTTKKIINAYSVAGWAAQNISIGTNLGQKVVNSGALTSNALATVFSKLDGPCEFSQLYCITADATARTMRLKVTVDGVVVFDYTSASITNAAYGCCLAGNQLPTNNLPLGSIKSSSTLVVEIASNLTETDKFTIGYAAQELN